MTISSKQARQCTKQVVHFLRKSTTYADGQSAVIDIGVIPAGSIILKAMSGLAVNVAFNDATNKLIHVGTSGNTDLFGTSLSVASIAFVPLDEAIGGYLVTSDTVITMEHARTGTAATAGSAEAIIAYIPDIDR